MSAGGRSTSGKAARRTSGKMGFDLPSQMDIDPIYPISIQTNHSEHLPLWSHVKAREEMTELGFKFHSCQNCLTVRGLCMAFAGIKTTPVKKVSRSNSQLCRLCEVNIDVHDRYLVLFRARKKPRRKIHLRESQVCWK